jgi:hypothetical protein
MSSYTVTAYQRGQQARTLQLVAVSPTIAVRTAMELMPGWLISSPVHTPEWNDDNA